MPHTELAVKFVSAAARGGPEPANGYGPAPPPEPPR